MNAALQKPLQGFAAATLATGAAPSRLRSQAMDKPNVDAPQAPHTPAGELSADERAWVNHLTDRGYLG